MYNQSAPSSIYPHILCGSIHVLTKRRVQHNPIDPGSILQSNPSLNSTLLHRLVGHLDDTTPAGPVALATIARTLAIAHIQALVFDKGPRNRRIPPRTPGIPVIMPVEQPHQRRRRRQGHHKRLVVASVVTPGSLNTPAVAAVATPPSRLHTCRVLVVEPRVRRRVDALLLQHPRRVRGQVHKRQRGNRPAGLLGEHGIRLEEPLDNILAHPVFLRHRVPVFVHLVVHRAAATVEEPEEKLGDARPRGLAVLGIHGDVVVGDSVLAVLHMSVCSTVFVFYLGLVQLLGGRPDRVVVGAEGRTP